MDSSLILIGIMSFVGSMIGFVSGRWSFSETDAIRAAKARTKEVTAERDRLVELLKKRTVDFKNWPRPEETRWVRKAEARFSIRRESLRFAIQERWIQNKYVRATFAVLSHEGTWGAGCSTVKLISDDRARWCFPPVSGEFGLNGDVKAQVDAAVDRAIHFMQEGELYDFIFELATLETIVKPEVRFVEVPFLASADPEAEDAVLAARKEEAAQIAARLEVDSDLKADVMHALRVPRSS